MTDYAAKLAALRSRLDSRAASARQLLVRHEGWIDRYRGGMSGGLFAAIMYTESGGNFGAAGDVSLGEVGYYQITASFPETVGIDPDVRRDPEGNVFLAGLQYQVRAAGFEAAFPGVVRRGTVDQWKLARLAFAVGNHAAQDLLRRARAARARGAGPWAQLVAYVDDVGGVAYGSQSADKVWYRVHVVDVDVAVGDRVRQDGYHAPEILPAPSGVSYRFPAALRRYAEPAGSAVASIITAGLFVALLILGS